MGCRFVLGSVWLSSSLRNSRLTESFLFHMRSISAGRLIIHSQHNIQNLQARYHRCSYINGNNADMPTLQIRRACPIFCWRSTLAGGLPAAEKSCAGSIIAQGLQTIERLRWSEVLPSLQALCNERKQGGSHHQATLWSKLEVQALGSSIAHMGILRRG